MRHHNRNKKFGRVQKTRTALMRELARALILKERIVTTEAKAKTLRPYIERLITQGKKETLASRRLVADRFGGDRVIARKLVNDIVPRYKNRSGGYVRVTKLATKRSDAAKEAQIEFV